MVDMRLCKGKDRLRMSFEALQAREKILKVIDMTTEKLEIALCLPMFIEGCAYLLPYYFQPDEIRCIKLCSRYSTAIDNQSKHQINGITETLESGLEHMRRQITEFQSHHVLLYMQDVGRTEIIRNDLTPNDNMTDQDVCRAIDLLYSKPEIRSLVKNHLLPGISPASKTFLEYFAAFKEVAKDRLSETALNQYCHRLGIKYKMALDEKIVEDKDITQESKVKQKMYKNISISERKNKLKSLNKEKESLENRNQKLIKQCIEISESDMCEAEILSGIKQNALQVQYQEAKKKYDDLLLQHLSKEKETKLTKTKFKSLLDSMKEKHWIEIKIRQNEIDELTKQQNTELKQKEELKILFDIQEKEYEQMILEKVRKFEERIYLFRVKRAARIIQKYWRAYRTVRKAKVKPKRGKRRKNKRFKR